MIAACLALYLPSLQNFVGRWDTGELQTVAAIGGIAHPTGFPAFTMLGWLFSHALITYEPWGRLAVMSALFTAASAAMAYLCAVKLGASRAIAAAAAIAFAAGGAVWDCATRADVHPMALALDTGALYALLEWRARQSERALAAAALLLGLALATHAVAIWTVFAALVLVAPRVRQISLRHGLRAAALVAAALMLYAYLPIRSAIIERAQLDPSLRLGLASGPYWDYDRPATPAGFIRLVTASEFEKGTGLLGAIDPRKLPEHLTTLGSRIVSEYDWAFVVFALVGSALLARRDPCAALAFAIFALGPAFFVQGFEESDPYRYFMPAFWTAAVALALALSEAIDARSANLTRRAIVTALVCVLSVTLVARHPDRMHRRDYSALYFQTAVLEKTDPHAILIMDWIDASSLAFFAYAEHTLGDRIIVTGHPPQYASHLHEWLKTRRVYTVGGGPLLLPGYRVYNTVDRGVAVAEIRI